MKMPRCFFLLLVVVLLGFRQNAVLAKEVPLQSELRDTKDPKAIITDYINALGGMDALGKLKTVSSTGNLTVQGTTLDVVQKQMVPNKTLQVVMMNGDTVGKTVFNGTTGYTEQMGNHVDMSDEDMADIKGQTSIIEQANYLSNNNYKLSYEGVDTVDGKEAYKISVTSPSGKTGTEYYGVDSKLLVRKDLSKSVNGQAISTVYDFGDYRKTGDVLIPYTLGLHVSAGAMEQTITISLTDVKINEGVTDDDFN